MFAKLLVIASVGVAARAAAVPAVPGHIARPANVAANEVTRLDQSDIASFLSYSLIAGAAYCRPEVIASWECGHNCDALPGFKVTGSGGDGNAIQYWFTAYSESTKSVVVAHQGTDPTKCLSVLTDVNLFLKRPNATIFPGLADDVEMHGGFLAVQALTADAIYDDVVKTMQQYNTTSVNFVGHSLGAALSLLDALSLRLRLPEGTDIRVVNYGMPRVGNQGFADAVDKYLPNLTRITNRQDPIPIVPGRHLGFVQPSGEVHIDSDGNWISCPGQDSEDPQCTVENVSLLPFKWSIMDHIGYYADVLIQCWGLDEN